MVEDQFEVSCGNAKIYYDNAEMLGDSATLKVEVNLGNAVIYVPQSLESGFLKWRLLVE